MIEERQLRYAGHVWRYDDNRWTKFKLQAERPSQKNGKQQQYRKHLTKLLKEKNLDTSVMTDPVTWAKKLEELYPKGKKNKKRSPRPTPAASVQKQMENTNIEIQA